ncbi:MAG TPA: hypothetical protein VH933_07670 [Aestuariivirgaceae bacterium]|jgi:hypothetical protein
MLIEALVALAVTACTVVMALSSLAEGAARLRQLEERTEALAEARSIIAEAGTVSHVSVLTRSGTTPLGHQWSMEIRETPSSQKALKMKPFRIVLHLTMQNAGPPLVIETYVISQLKDE